ncbi:hypothetical protein XCV1964 [Xanthomonas euvesicatoria pv. vesicatoria str. 85-10]|uniref:Uncharacterized protein n=1 Tax=Xanthomonas euvesicatoria pv. vesicatoria (strain 85-10) TaxID=316273 RepID=Q3BU68_XANE5|nr:hypothetical protein XCV1964 [Xanthomonas euvesicatoria pv. vesicatoria str. 85-10]
MPAAWRCGCDGSATVWLAAVEVNLELLFRSRESLRYAFGFLRKAKHMKDLQGFSCSRLHFQHTAKARSTTTA